MATHQSLPSGLAAPNISLTNPNYIYRDGPSFPRKNWLDRVFGGLIGRITLVFRYFLLAAAAAICILFVLILGPDLESPDTLAFSNPITNSGTLIPAANFKFCSFPPDVKHKKVIVTAFCYTTVVLTALILCLSPLIYIRTHWMKDSHYEQIGRRDLLTRGPFGLFKRLPNHTIGDLESGYLGLRRRCQVAFFNWNTYPFLAANFVTFSLAAVPGGIITAMSSLHDTATYCSKVRILILFSWIDL